MKVKERCHKVIFGSKIDAMIALSRRQLSSSLNRRQNDWRNECRIYFCGECDGWHLTSKKRKVNR